MEGRGRLGSHGAAVSGEGAVHRTAVTTDARPPTPAAPPPAVTRALELDALAGPSEAERQARTRAHLLRPQEGVQMARNLAERHGCEPAAG